MIYRESELRIQIRLNTLVWMCQVQHYPIEEEANWVLAEEGEAEYHLVLMMLLESGLARRSGDVLRETCPSYSLAVRPVSGAGLKLLYFFHSVGDPDLRVWASRIQIRIH